MLSLNQIKAYYPESLQGFESFMLREYLQFKILEIIFDSPYTDKLSFLGGTCLRIVHGNTRFSEDIDFDSFNLQIEDFNTITDIVKRKLELTGYEVEIRNVHKGAYHCYIRFPKLLFNEGLSGNKEEKILIQLDTEPHHFKYTPEKPILNKFDVFTQINSTPKDILLSQKFYAVINRKRNKGRDFFDIVFLLGQGQKPNYEYLNEKIGVQNPIELKSKILDKCAQLDMNEMANDVSPFLFQSNDVKKVLLFTQYIQQIEM